MTGEPELAVASYHNQLEGRERFLRRLTVPCGEYSADDQLARSTAHEFAVSQQPYSNDSILTAPAATLLPPDDFLFPPKL